MTKTFLAAALGVACTLAQAEPISYATDSSHSNVTWEIVHMNTSTLRGRFLVKQGTITIDKATQTGKADVTIDLASLSGPVKHLDDGLRGERGFNLATASTARFVSENFKLDNDKVASVPGTLTLMGKSLPVTLQTQRFNCYANPMLQGRETCGGDFEATISRSAFGVNIAAPAAADNVRLLIEVEAIRQ